jgi:hypothetical protein
MKKILVLLVLLVTVNVTWAQKWIDHNVKVSFDGTRPYSRIDGELTIYQDTTILEDGTEYKAWNIYLKIIFNETQYEVIYIKGLLYVELDKYKKSYFYTNDKACDGIHWCKWDGIDYIRNYGYDFRCEVLSVGEKLSKMAVSKRTQGALIIDRKARAMGDPSLRFLITFE